MTEDKKSFLVYHDIAPILKKLSDEQAGKLFKAMVEYSTERIDPDFDDLALELTFIPIAQQIDRNIEKWEDIREKRVESGRKGGLKSAETRRQANQANQANEANATFATFASEANEANQAVKVTVKDKVKVKVKDKVTVKDNDKVTVPIGGGSSPDGSDDEFNIYKSMTPDDVDSIYDVYPESGGFLIQAVYEEVKQKRKRVRDPVPYILGYAKNVNWDDNGDYGEVI